MDFWAYSLTQPGQMVTKTIQWPMQLFLYNCEYSKIYGISIAFSNLLSIY